MTSFNLNYFFKGPFSRCGHILSPSGLEHEYMNLGGKHSQPIAVPFAGNRLWSVILLFSFDC